MARALIVSVGGSSEPVAKSIAEHEAELLCFFASQNSVISIGPALTRAQDLLGDKWQRPRYQTILADDAEDLAHCYGRALSCAAWIEDQGVNPGAVIVDYTGGTKTMTAALALATIGKGFSFSYVGGKERDKEGVGVVVSGTEVVRAGLDPWRLYAVEERRKIASAFNAFQFDAALGAAGDLLKRGTVGPAQRRWYEGLCLVCEGYRAWDRFEYAEALDRLRRVRKSLETLADLGPEKEARALAETLTGHVGFLETLKAESDRFQEPCPVMVRDLIGNAQRRASEGKFDDAVARLYRATEMIAQLRFLEPPLGAPTGEVPPERIPEDLREEYCKKYLDSKTGRLKLPLLAAFRVLKLTGIREGEVFFARRSEFDGLLGARNRSLLAHGFSPVRPDTYEQLRTLVVGSFTVGEPPVFPRLSLAG